MASTITSKEYNGDGSTKTFTYAFQSYQVEDVKVKVNEVAVTNFTIPNYAASGGTVTFNNTGVNASVCESDGSPKNTLIVRVYRETDITAGSVGEYEPKATYVAGSSIKAADLNNNAKQALYASFEHRDQEIQETKIRDGAVTSAKIKDDTIVNADINSAAAIEFTKLENLDSAKILVGNGSNKAAEVAVSGDVTMANTGAVTLANDSITSAKIADDAVDSEHYAADSIDSEHYAPGSVDTTALATGAVGESQIANDSISLAKMKANSVDSDQYVDGSIDTAHLTTGCVTSSIIANEAVTAARIAGGSVTAAKIGTGAVTSEKLADDAVTSVKLQDHASNNAYRAVTSDHIVDDAVTADKLADNAVVNASVAANAAIDATKIADGSVTSTEFQYINSVTSNVQTQIDAKQASDAQLTTLAGMQSGTASILASGTALTSTTAELNLLDGKSIVTTISSPTDVQIPTAQAVDERIVDLVTDVGGFRPIANETSFPTTNPDPEDNAGTIVSVKALASNLTSNGSGVATIANGAGSGNTVTINGMANSDTIEAGKGILVETTSTLHTYTFHRETLAPADITSAKTAVDDFNERYRVHAGEPSSSLNEGDLVYDTNADKMKVYDSSTSAWKEVTSTGDFKYLFLCPAGGSGAPTINGSIATYDLREGSNSGSAASVTNAAQLIVSVNGVIQKANTGTSAPAEGFALVDANTIIFSTNLPNGASVFIHQAGSAVSIPTPGDNTVSTAKIQNLAVTTGNIADQAVDLTKLPHGDGTSNGKFLRSNNGADPTWETVAQGTPTDITVADESSDTTCFPLFVTAATGDLAPKSGSNLTFNSNTGALGATSFTGDGSSLTGVASSSANGTMYKNTLSITDAHTIAAT